MLCGRRYLLDLSPVQAQMCEEFGRICRAVWNTGLEQRRAYRQRGAWIDYGAQAAQLAEAMTEHPWLKGAPVHVLRHTLQDLDRACRKHGTFEVRWRSKSRWPPSFRFPAGHPVTVERLGRKWGRVKLPELGWVRFRWSRPPGGEVRSVTLSRRGGRWFVDFLVDGDLATCGMRASPDMVRGVGGGSVRAAGTDEGAIRGESFFRPGEAERYRRLQHRLSRQKKGSANRGKTISAMGRIMDRVTDRRDDFHAHEANRVERRDLPDANSGKRQAETACGACYHTERADLNTTKSTKAAGRAASACGDLGNSRSVKQEPAGRVTGPTPA